jgi:hypothetical protein
VSDTSDDPTEPTDPDERHVQLDHRTGAAVEDDLVRGGGDDAADTIAADEHDGPPTRESVPRHGDPRPDASQRPTADGTDRRGTPPDRT